MMKVWYEVFIDNGIETMTLEICNRLKEAKKRKIYYSNHKNSEEEVHIDKWRNTENPECIGAID